MIMDARTQRAIDAIRRAANPLPEQTRVRHPITVPQSPLGVLLCKRRSNRDYSGAPIPQPALDRLLLDACGGVSYSPRGDVQMLHRTIPQAGGIESTRHYCLLLKPTEALPIGTYALCPYTNALHRHGEPVAADQLDAAFVHSLEPGIHANASAIFVFTANVAAKAYKYGGARAAHLCLIEAGCALQNLLLSATDVGVACCAHGGFDANALAMAMGITSSDEMPVATAIAGMPAEASLP